MSDTIHQNGHDGFERVQQRLDELERENQRLASQVEALTDGGTPTPVRPRRGPPPRAEDIDVAAVEDGSLGRRSALKRFGQVAAAGVGMAAVGGVLRPEPALAEHGTFPIEMGHDNSAGADRMTTVEMQTSDPNTHPHVLQLNNTGIGGALKLASAWSIAAPLQLEPGGDVPTIGPKGSLGTDESGGITDLYFFHTRGESKDGSDSEVGRVYTSQWANFLSFLPSPVRTLDTRNDSTHPEGSAGKLKGTYTIDVSGDVPSNTIAVYGTLAAVNPSSPGFLSLWQDGGWPGTANLNYPSGLTLSSLQTTLLTSSGTFELRVDGLSHVTFDIIAVVVPS